MGALVNPTRWLDVWRYLLFRDGVPLPPAATVAVGLTPELAGRVTPATGPFNLSDRPGPGTEPGQFKDPIGVAVGRTASSPSSTAATPGCSASTATASSSASGVRMRVE